MSIELHGSRTPVERVQRFKRVGHESAPKRSVLVLVACTAMALWVTSSNTTPQEPQISAPVFDHGAAPEVPPAGVVDGQVPTAVEIGQHLRDAVEATKNFGRDLWTGFSTPTSP